MEDFNYQDPTYIKICQALEKQLLAIKPDKTISGMALGVDQYFANICIKLKIPFIAAIPFEGQEKAWPLASQKTYQLLRKSAAEEVIVSEGGYSSHKMQVRNQYIVGHCDILIAVFDGSKGGTYNCIEYAKSFNKEIIIINTND